MLERREAGHGTDSLVITDPTSTQRKNATPSCFRVKEILAFFRELGEGLGALRARVGERFEAARAVGELSAEAELRVLEEAGMVAARAEMRKKKPAIAGILRLIEFRNMHTTLEEV